MILLDYDAEVFSLQRFLTILLCFVLCFSLAGNVSAANAKVDLLEAELTVNEDGSCAVSFTATIQFLSPAESFAIPLAAGARDIAVSGPKHEIEEIDGVQTVVFESGFTGKATFLCSYTLACVVTEEESGVQHVSVALPQKGWPFPIEHYEMTVHFPAEITDYPTWRSAYHGIDIDNYLDISIEEASVRVKSLERLKDRETITMEISYSANTFDLSNQPGQTVSIATVLFWLFFVCCIGYWFFRLRTKRPKAAVRYTAVNEFTAGEIPCQLFGASPDIVGILAHWGNLGYLTIRRSRKGRVTLHKQMEMDSERSASERKLFYSLFRNSSAIDALESRVLNVSKKIGPTIRKSWIRRLYRKDSGSPFLLRAMALATAAVACLILFDLILPGNFWRWFLLPICSMAGVLLSYFVQRSILRLYTRSHLSCLILGIVSAMTLLALSIIAGCVGTMLASLLLQTFCAGMTMFGGLRNDPILVDQLLGLRSFLRSADIEALRRLTLSDSQYFYRMLPFAEQLGVAPAFARRCGVLQPEPCPWLLDALTDPRTAPEFYTTYRQIAALIRKEFTLSQGTSKPAPSEVSHG